MVREVLLASRCKSAHMRIGNAQVLVRINWDVIDSDFVVEMRAGAASAVTNVADGIPTMHVLPGIHGEALHVSIACGDAMAMIENDGASVSTHKVGELDNGICRCHDRLTVHATNVDAGVESALTIEWIDAFSK